MAYFSVCVGHKRKGVMIRANCGDESTTRFLFPVGTETDEPFVQTDEPFVLFKSEVT